MAQRFCLSRGCFISILFGRWGKQRPKETQQLEHSYSEINQTIQECKFIWVLLEITEPFLVLFICHTYSFIFPANIGNYDLKDGSLIFFRLICPSLEGYWSSLLLCLLVFISLFLSTNICFIYLGAIAVCVCVCARMYTCTHTWTLT